jgi:predicted Ser/Thr protein kinase
VRHCPACAGEFPDSVETCPTDGAPLEPADPLVGTTIRGRYQVVRKLGEGGVGAVYLAEQVKIRRPVALKVLRAEAARDQAVLEQFRLQVRAMVRLDPRYVTMVHDLDQTEDGRLFIVMEYLEGRTLEHLLRAEGALTLPRALALATQLAEGLNVAHAAGVVHGEVTPRAIMVLRDDSVKLMDFGLGRLNRGRAGRAGAQRDDLDGHGRAQRVYAAPESLRGDANARADVYSLGAVLYQMLTGEPPASSAPTGRPERERPRERRPSVPESLDALVMQMLEPSPDRRPRDLESALGQLRAAAGEVAQRLMSGEIDQRPIASREARARDDTVGMPAPAVGRDGAPESAGRRSSWSPVAWWAAAAAIAVAIGVVVAGRWSAVSTPTGPVVITTPERVPPPAPPPSAADRPEHPLAPPPTTAERAPDQPGSTGPTDSGESGGPVSKRPTAPREPAAPRPPAESTKEVATPRPPLSPPGETKPSGPSVSPPASKGSPEGPVTAIPGPPRPPAPDPAQIRAQVQERLRGRGLLREGSASAVGLAVEVTSDGAVTLTGVLHTREERDRAVALAREVSGVGEVRARINVMESWKGGS